MVTHTTDTTALLAKTKLEARPYQQRIIGNTLDYYINDTYRSILVESPTGSGKTSMGLTICRGMQDHFGDNDIAIGWVSMRRNLLTQSAEENRIKNINANVHMISMFDKTLPPALTHGHPDAARRRLLVIDESQHDAAASCVHIHSLCRPDYVLGLSATPFRADRVKLCFDKTIKDAGLAALIKDGYLSPYHYYSIPQFDVDAVTDLYISDRQRWGKSLMFFHRKEHAYEAAHKLEVANVRCSVVTGESDRDQQIEDFSTGKLDVLLNCMVLTEGFNDPSVKSVFLRPSCKGVTIQMAGRAFRLHKDLPYKQIIQPKLKAWPFPKFVEPVDQFTWTNGSWRSLKPNARTHELSCRMLSAIAQIDARLPDFIINKKKKGRKSAAPAAE